MSISNNQHTNHQSSNPQQAYVIASESPRDPILNASHSFSAGFNYGFAKGLSEGSGNALTQGETQCLVAIMSKLISSYNEELDYLKLELSHKWTLCNPDQPDSQVYFDNFSCTRSMYLRIKNQRDSLAGIQNKLKKLR